MQRHRSPLHLTGAGFAGEDEAAGTKSKVDAAGGHGDPHHVVRHGRGDPPAVVLLIIGHRALLGILVLRPQSLRCEWAHANGSGPNPSLNDPHVTHVGDFLLHPRGRFQGRRPTQPWGRWCRGLQITARRGCRAPPPPLPPPVPPAQQTSGLGHSPVPPHLRVCRIFPAQRGKKSSSPAQ